MDVLNNQLCEEIFCVIPANSNEVTCTKNLFLAYKCCKKHGLNIVQLSENDCLKLKPSKKNVFILAEFGSSLLEHLQGFECTIVGPQVLLDSVNNSYPIPAKTIFNLSMKGITATTTGFNVRKNKEIEMKIQFMGGIYSSELTSSTTHLIAKSTTDFSMKFKAARSRTIPIMTSKWLNAVWDARMQEDIHGNDVKFANYACSLFQGFVVCVSRISFKERDAIKKIFEANGGQYSAELEKGKTNILLTPSAEGDKYTYARRWKIRCLKPEWVQSSLDQGYVCDPEPYAVEKTATCSTPEAHCRSKVVNFNNDSVNSTIVNYNSITSQMDETNVNASTPPIKQKCDPWATEPLECLDLALSLKAGRFLEGFRISPIGFDGPQMEKLRRILKNAGVIQLNTINDESISHVIVGNTGKEDDLEQLQQLTRKPYVVTVEWLTQSLQLKAPAPEAEYLHPYYKNLFTLSSQKGFSKEPTPELVSMTTRDSQDDTRTSVHYVRTLSKQTTAIKDDSTTEQNNNCFEEKDLQTASENYTTADEIDSEEDVAVFRFCPADALFSHVTFQLVGLIDAGFISWTTDLIESNGGRMLASGANYKVTAPVIHADLLPDDPVGQTVLINTFWIEDCIDEDRLVEIEIYHLPIKFQNSQIFSGCVVSISGIQGRLRDFLHHLVEHLGGKQQEFFSRKMVEARDIYPSTHLVCPKAEGTKYEKAVKWGVLVVNPEWIIASASSSTRLKETDYPSEAGTATGSMDFTVPTPLTAVRIFRQPVVPAEKLSLPAIYFDAPLPDTVMGPPTIPLMLPVLADPTSELLQSSNGTSTFGISPTPRPALSNMPTPETPYGRLLNPNPSPDTRKLWKHALDNRVRLTPKPDDSPTITSTHQNESQVLNSVAMAYFENLHKKMLSCSWEVIDEVTHAEASSLPASNLPPLHDASIFIGQEIEEDKRSQMEEFIKTLGGRVILQHCQEVTHFVCQGELTASADMQNAKKWNQLFVLPQWILDCEFAACRLKESYYQPSLNIETVLSPDVATGRTSGLLETIQKLESLPNRLAEEEKPLQIEQVLPSPTLEISLPNDPVAGQLENVPVHMCLVPPPCSSAAVSQISQEQNASQRLNASQYSGHSFRIMFSGMPQEDRGSCVQIVKKLGGIVIDGSQYDSTCTHLVVAKLECNNKLMTSIAAGKWIVHPGWIAESEKSYRFVDERKFEWGDPTSNDSISKEEARIASAAYYWRTSRNFGLSTGPFQGIKAALHLRKNNDAFQQLVEAGGGEVIAPELALENGKTNLCVLDSHEISKINLTLYASRGIYCVPPNYLKDLILALDKKFQWMECVLPEFLPYLDDIPSTNF